MIAKWEGAGTVEVTGFGLGSLLGGAAVVAAVMAVVAILAAIFWILLAVGIVLLAVIAGLIVLIRRSMAAHRPAFTVRAEVLREPRRHVAAAQPPAVVNHYNGGTHLHVGPGTDPAVIRQAIPLGVTEEE
ncbi:MAG: hypothetical protein ACRDN1_25275 [Trebonia sp.]